jgi:hypothetical protein
VRQLVAVFALATAIGCSASDRDAAPVGNPISKSQLRTLLDDVAVKVRAAYLRVDEAAERRNTGQLRRALRRAAHVEELQTQRLEQVIAPREAERPLGRLVRASQEEAKQIRALARRKDLTAKVVQREALLENRADGEILRALTELGEHGFGGPSG